MSVDFSSSPEVLIYLGVAALFTLIAILFLAGGFRDRRKARQYSEDLVSKEVTIVDYEQVMTMDDGVDYAYYPIVKYEENGSIKQLQSRSGFAKSVLTSHPVGETTTVYYPPDKLAEFQFTTAVNNSYIILWGTGAVFFAIGLYCVYEAITRIG